MITYKKAILNSETKGTNKECSSGNDFLICMSQMENNSKTFFIKKMYLCHYNSSISDVVLLLQKIIVTYFNIRYDVA